MNTKTKNFLAIIIGACSIGIIALKYHQNENLDTFIFPIILMCLAIVILFSKSNPNERRLNLTKKQKNFSVAFLSASLIAGIITFFVA